MRALHFIFAAVLIVFTGCQQTTNPDRLINQKASLPESFKLSALHEKVITSFINKNDSTMGILYGNKAGENVLTSTTPLNIDSVSLTLVTWHQQNDSHWFGARIPGQLQTVEVVTITNGKDFALAGYSKFAGKDLVKVTDTLGQSARIKFILAQKPSIIP